LDLAKVRLQTSPYLYRGAIDCLIKVGKIEGIKNGLYKGIGAPLVSLTILNSLSFGFYSSLKNFLQGLHPSGTYSPAHDIINFFAAGGITGFVSSVVSTPFDLVKVRLQLDNISERRFHSSIGCARTLWKDFGPSVFYTGYVTNTFREVIFCSVYFGIYETSKRSLTSYFGDSDARLALFVASSGGTAGVLAWLASFPLDVVKSIIQGESLRRQDRKSFWKVVNHRWKTLGFFGFYSGVSPSLMRAFLVSSTRFSAFELALKALNVLDDSWA
jgi:solute carrier family 25 carnitine/acylcarnitine transporter 20/29